MASITSINSVYIITIPNVIFPTQLQGFSADDIFGTDPLEVAETMMGVDGILSAGLINVPVQQGISLQADSASNAIFDTWYAQQRLIRDIYFANANVTLTSIGKKFALTNGALKTYPPLPDAGKVLKPRKFTIVWESITPAPF
jgi:hypothetical protein